MMNLIEKIQDAIITDDTDSSINSIRLAAHYFNLNVSEKKKVNSMFISLCGWSLETLIKGGE